MKKLLASMLLLLSSISFYAQADVFNVGILTPQEQVPTINSFLNEGSKSFIDTYNFNLVGDALFTSNVVFGGVSSFSTALNFGTTTIGLPSTTVSIGALSAISTTSVLLGAGSYSFFVSGSTTNGGYIGSFTVGNPVPVASVPELETSAMFLIGLGLLGFVARRRT